jgi:hypothetical protein
MNSTSALRRLLLSGVAFASIHASNARAETIRFVVAEPPGQVVHGDSYILPLTDPADIAHARALISSPPGTLSSIVVANIAEGSDGVNRDWLASGKPAWSWHVTEFQGFADFTVEVLDGWPTFVEQDIPGWIANTGGQIGFWSYTVVAELPVPEPRANAILAIPLVILAAACRRVERQLPKVASAPATLAQKKPSAPPRVFDARHSVPI